MYNRRVPSLTCLALGLSLLAGPVCAQTTNATLLGSVLDSQSSVIAGATVTVKDKGTGIARTVQTDSTGNFRVFPLNPGRYEVSASMAGFKTKVIPEVILEIASVVKVGFPARSRPITGIGRGHGFRRDSPNAGSFGRRHCYRLRTFTLAGERPQLHAPYLAMPGTSDQGGSQSKGPFPAPSLFLSTASVARTTTIRSTASTIISR